jgi:uncharacterized protein (DUF1684 family)
MGKASWIAILLLTFLQSCIRDEYSMKIQAERDFWNEDLLEQIKPYPELAQKFVGRRYFKIDKTLNLSSTFIPFVNKDTLYSNTSLQGDKKRLVREGEVHFTLEGKKYTLTVFRHLGFPFDDLFIPFADSTNNYNTCQFGRYLNVKRPPGDIINLDFNLAYHPPCFLFSELAKKLSCPVIPEGNKLPVGISAGEQNPQFNE